MESSLASYMPVREQLIPYSKTTIPKIKLLNRIIVKTTIFTIFTPFESNPI